MTASKELHLQLSREQQRLLENWLLDFEKNWSSTSLDRCRDRLNSQEAPFHRAALVELIKVDLERRWQSDDRVSLESYIERFDILESGDAIPVDLIQAEIEVRRQFGAASELPELLKRFPGREKELQQIFNTAATIHAADTSHSPGDTAARDRIAVSPVTDEILQTGRHFGRYHIQQELGSGAMGKVLLAEDTVLGRRVALKIPHFSGSSRQEVLDRFLREARAAATIDHPNICPIYDVGELDGVHFISMAFIEGQPLSAFISGSKQLKQRSVAMLVRKLALGLVAAHEKGIVHRDLKPDNIMIKRGSEPIVMDFGLAFSQQASDESRMTQEGTLLGSPAYMSVEQVEGRIGDVGPQSDVYSLGVILYELLTGEIPFQGNVTAVISKILTEPARPPRQVRDDVDPTLESICLKMMSKPPGDRHADMKAVANDLTAFLKQERSSAGSETIGGDDDATPLFADQAPPSGDAAGEFDPYHKWLGIPRRDQPPHHYRLLAIDLFEADLDVIDSAAMKQIAHIRQCATGPHGEASQQILNNLSAAQLCLLDPSQKAAYDKRLKAELEKGSAPAEQNEPAQPAAEDKPDKQTQKLEKQKQQIESLLEKCEFAAAIGALEKMTAIKNPRQAKYARWAKQQLPSAKRGTKDMHASSAAMYRTAAELFDRHDYEEAAEILKQIPQKYRDAKTSELLTECLDLQEEVASLQEDIDRADALKKYDDLLPTVKRLLEVKPNDRRAKRLFKELKTYGKGGGMRLGGRGDGRFDAAGNSSSPLKVALFVGIPLVLFGVMSWATVIYVRSGDKTIRIEIEDPTAQVSVDGDEIEITGIGDTIKLKPGLHDLVVKRGDIEVHTRQFEVVKGKNAVLRITLADLEGIPSAAPSPVAPQADRNETISLFDGETLDGWRIEGNKGWTVEGEELVGTAIKSRLVTDREDFDDFEVRVECKLAPGSNSGVFARTAFGAGWQSGYEAQLSNQSNQRTLTGGVFGLADLKESLVPDDEWLELRFRVEGRQLTVFVNGKQTAKVDVAAGGPTEGAIALQSWNNRPVRFRKVEVTMLGPRDGTGNTDGDAPPLAVAPFDATTAKRHQQAWADHLGVPVERVVTLPGGGTVALMLIPPGEFMMGSTAKEQTQFLDKANEIDDQPALKRIRGEGPIHRVRITRPFYLGKYEVTQAQWQAVMGGNSADFKGEPTRPVDRKSWDDIQPFLSKLNAAASVGVKEFRLPSEAQWEYACRAGTTTIWHTGDDEAVLNEYGWFKTAAAGDPRPVGRLKPNAWNLHDMHGNLWEWCADRYSPSYYTQETLNDPSGPTSGTLRMLRGGAWHLPSEYSRSAHRFGMAAARQSATLGFRLAAVVAETAKTARMPAPAEPANDAPASAVAPFDAATAKQHQQAWADHLGVPIETTNSIGMKFRVIPPGKFLMGSSKEELAKLLEEANEQKLPGWYINWLATEGPQHAVTLTKPFGASIFEVTRGQFRQFVKATGYTTDAEKDGKGASGWKDGSLAQAPEFLWNTKLGFDTEQTDDHPVVNVSWNDAVAFCGWLSKQEGVMYRLPTEAEWEFACRGGSLGRYSCSDEQSLVKAHAWFDTEGGNGTKPVGRKQANALGLFDLHGNVWEWCHDWHLPYTDAPAIDPVGPAQGLRHVLRGGSYNNRRAIVRSANRSSGQADDRLYSYGFRVVRTFDSTAQTGIPQRRANGVFLADLKEISENKGLWPLGKGKTGGNLERDIEYDGVKYPHGLSVHPSTRGTKTVQYRLAGKYREFSSQVVLLTYPAGRKAASHYTFTVVGDGKTLWASKPTKQPQGPQACRVDVSKIDVLELRASCAGGSRYGNPVWLDPQLTR